jgi:hypothetical protein
MNLSKLHQGRAPGTLGHRPQGLTRHGRLRYDTGYRATVGCELIDGRGLTAGQTVAGQIEDKDIETPGQAVFDQFAVEAGMVVVTVHQQQGRRGIGQLPAVHREAMRPAGHSAGKVFATRVTRREIEAVKLAVI